MPTRPRISWPRLKRRPVDSSTLPPAAPSAATLPAAAGAADLTVAVPAPPPGPMDTAAHPAPAPPLVAQPVIAMRARSHLRMLTAGLVFALLGAVSTVGASVTMLRLHDSNPILPAVGNAGSVVTALIACIQFRLWQLALREWEGRSRSNVHAWLNVSATGSWLSVLGAAATAWSSWAIVDSSVRSETSWWLALFGAVFVILGATLAGVHRLHPQGPRGVPDYIRRNHDRHPVEVQRQLDRRPEVGVN